MTAYRVVGQCAHVRTRTDAGVMTLMLYKGSPVPADAPADQIRHLLSVGLIAQVGGTAKSAPPVVEPALVTEPETPQVPVVANSPDPALDAERQAAREKLPSDGSAPDGRASKAVWVEYAVASGYDYDTVAAAEKADIVALFK